MSSKRGILSPQIPKHTSESAQALARLAGCWKTHLRCWQRSRALKRGSP